MDCSGAYYKGLGTAFPSTPHLNGSSCAWSGGRGEWRFSHTRRTRTSYRRDALVSEVYGEEELKSTGDGDSGGTTGSLPAGRAGGLLPAHPFPAPFPGPWALPARTTWRRAPCSPHLFEQALSSAQARTTSGRHCFLAFQILRLLH